MARLAARYPGALRELDALPLDVIEQRIRALEEATTTGSPTRWMIAQLVFHRFSRGALAAKRWLSVHHPSPRGAHPNGWHATHRAEAAEAVREAFLAAALGAEAEQFADALEVVAAPPRGRLMDLVHARVAAALSVTEAEARALVFGHERSPGPG